MSGEHVEITAGVSPQYAAILTAEAIEFVAKLERQFRAQRQAILRDRVKRQQAINEGQMPTFLSQTESVRATEWQVASTPPDLQKRWVEITGPTDRKMVINALNSGADIFMTDFEDSNVPTWDNMIQGQINLRDANLGAITLLSEGKTYQLNEEIATLMVRPRGWHLDEKHVRVDGQAMSASLFDFGLYMFHNAQVLIDKGSGPYFYLPKLENHLEARLWNEVFTFAQAELQIAHGTIRATVLLETILAAFEMEEILYELRDHSAGMNAGRWDYIFSTIKKFRNQMATPLPDRSQITMTVPFMRAYTELLVRTCHKRGAHVIGGMAANIPRRDPKVNELAFAKVKADKEREAGDGFDGTWVAHPGLVQVAKEVFQRHLADQPHQKHRLREDVQVAASDLINFSVDGGSITEAGLRLNLNVAMLYIESWLRGTGAAAIYDLMEDAATAEIARAQVWQWLKNEARLPDGRLIDWALVETLIAEELEKICELVGQDNFAAGRFEEARRILTQLLQNDAFDDFLTLVAYDYID
jgi:malate synthase